MKRLTRYAGLIAGAALLIAGLGGAISPRCGSCGNWHKRKHPDCQRNGPYGGCLGDDKWKER